MFLEVSIIANSSAESGNMVIMTLSYTQHTGDKFLLTKYVRSLGNLGYISDSFSPVPASEISSSISLTNGPSF